MGTMAPFGQAAGLAMLLLGFRGSLSTGPVPLPPRPATTQTQTTSGARTAAPAPKAQMSAVLELQEDLAALGYLPVGWDGHAFTFPLARMPAPLRSLFQPGVYSVLLRGAELTYEAQRGLPAGTGASRLLSSLRQDLHAGRRAPHIYTYVYVDAAVPERLVVWSTRGLLQSVPTNTGVARAATPLGTYPVYLRLPFQVMRGRNLGGAAYADPVYYISYFHGGDAVHGFLRQGYGYPQSLGCVEVPPWDAAAIFGDMQIGTLVTVGAGTLAYVATPQPLPATPATKP